MADRKLFCKDCTQEFIFSEGEQRFFADKGITEDPVRCPACRLKKKERIARLRELSARAENKQ